MDGRKELQELQEFRSYRIELRSQAFTVRRLQFAVCRPAGEQ
jgi:hypothetical protein